MIQRFFNSFWFVLIVGILILLSHLWLTRSVEVMNLSSDIWMVQYVSIQQHDQAWGYVPPFYNQEKYYLAYPILYYLNPGLERGTGSYQVAMLVLISLGYFLTSLVAYRVFRHWGVAALAGLLLVVPRQIFTTRIGLIGFDNFRGVGFSFVFYALLSYGWALWGILRPRWNLFFGLLAALSVYFYPPFGVVVVPLIILATAITSWRPHWRRILIFALVYLVGSSLFWVGHFTNPYSGMLDAQSDQEMVASSVSSAEILDYRIPDGSLRGIDFGVLKRAVWDTSPLLLWGLVSCWRWFRRRGTLSPEQKLFFHFNITLITVTVAFVAGVESVNWWRHLHQETPVFIEHLRLLRFLGFLLLMQAVWLFVNFSSSLRVCYWRSALLVTLLLFPLFFSAPLIRWLVRALVPTAIRSEYNLAPVIPVSATRSTEYLYRAAVWARSHLPARDTKIFAFSDEQEDFRFKVLSRRETNLTNKEGSIWITSGRKNSLQWYSERQEYDRVTSSGDFGEIIVFAKSLKATHLLLPRGRWSELYQASGARLRVMYENPDYSILAL